MSMKALVIADKRPDVDILQMLASQPVDIIITLGNLTMADIYSLAHVTHLPKIGVYGNHDDRGYFEQLGIWNLHMMTWQYNNRTFGGFEGCVRYKQDRAAIMYTQEEARSFFAHIPPVQIFLSHTPPRGVHDSDHNLAQQGFEALRQYIEAYQPSVVLHGHTTLQPGHETEQLGATRIEHVYGMRIIDL